MANTVHRIWDFQGDMAGIVWFRKEPDGSVQVLHKFVGMGHPLAHYVSAIRDSGGPDCIDYVRPDAYVKNLNGESLFEAMQRFGLHPEILPTPAWRSSVPFAEAA